MLFSVNETVLLYTEIYVDALIVLENHETD